MNNLKTRPFISIMYFGKIGKLYRQSCVCIHGYAPSRSSTSCWGYKLNAALGDSSILPFYQTKMEHVLTSAISAGLRATGCMSQSYDKESAKACLQEALDFLASHYFSVTGWVYADGCQDNPVMFTSAVSFDLIPAAAEHVDSLSWSQELYCYGPYCL